MDYKKLTAACGLDCFNCQLYENNITDKTKKYFAKALDCSPDEVKCLGCRVQGGCKLHFKDCATYDCSMEKGIDFCHECQDFPCNYFMPASDKADIYPHNFKLYNLARIKLLGFENWIREAGDIRLKYYKGKLIPGKGPAL